jgi:hypothetical protein
LLQGIENYRVLFCPNRPEPSSAHAQIGVRTDSDEAFRLFRDRLDDPKIIISRAFEANGFNRQPETILRARSNEGRMKFITRLRVIRPRRPRRLPASRALASRGPSCDLLQRFIWVVLNQNCDGAPHTVVGMKDIHHHLKLLVAYTNTD